MADMAKSSNMLIVPERPTDINGVLASAFGISSAVTKAASEQAAPPVVAR
jgi:hypothetical protein